MLTIAPSSGIAALPRNVGFPWGKLCAAQPLCDEGKPVVLTCLVRSLAFPLIRQFSRWSNCHLPPREGFWSGKAGEAMRRGSVGSPYEGELSAERSEDD